MEGGREEARGTGATLTRAAALLADGGILRRLRDSGGPLHPDTPWGDAPATVVIESPMGTGKTRLMEAFLDEAETKLQEVFGETPAYADILGLCKTATLEEIEAQGWSLNPGRYVGVAPDEEVSDEDFKEQLEVLSEELEVLNAQARELEETIARNVADVLDA